MKICGYEINFTENQLDDILNNKTRKIELIDKNFPAYQKLAVGDRLALDHLIKAADLINKIALRQDHPLNLTLYSGLSRASKESTYARKTLQLFQSLNGVAGHNGVDPQPVEIFKGVHLLAGKNFYPADMSIDEFHKIILLMAERRKIKELKKILSARTMVVRNGDELKGIDYTEYFANDFSAIANELEVAAFHCTDHTFKDYLGWQAQALLQNSPDMDMLADKHWALLQNCPLEFTISRENYEDEMTGTIFDNPEIIKIIGSLDIDVVSKDTLGCRVGLLNTEGTERILKSKETLPHLASWMPFNETYKQPGVSASNDVKQTMVDVDLIALTGDYAMCRGGITTAQNLPNNDKLSVKTGGGRRNVYHRQVRFSKDEERLKRLLDKLVDPDLHQYVDVEQTMGFVIGHENGHSLGPDSSYQNALGIYKHIVEEHKADVISVASIAELKRRFDAYKDVDLKKFYTTWIISDLLLRAEPVLSKPHRVAELIQFNYLLENKIISFDAQKKLHIDFKRIEDVLYRLLEDTIELQLSRSAEKAKEFINRWAQWGEWSSYIADVQQQIGIKPYIQIVSGFEAA